MNMRRHWGRVICGTLAVVFVLVDLALFAAVFCLNDEEYIAAHLPPKPVDETPPVVTLNGDEAMTVAVNSEYQDAGVKAYDVRGEVTIETEGEVDMATVGEYKIKYTVTDESGNVATAERTVKVVNPSGVVYLTFDDGPGPYTAALLDVLAKYNIKATFFVTGAGDDNLIKREYDEGHTVGLHTLSHNYAYIYSSTANFWADLTAVQERVKNITGYTSYLMRFPGGSSNLVSRRYDGGSHIMSKLADEVTNGGFTYFDWNVTSGDADNATSADAVYSNVVNALKYGGDSVVLQHDIKGFSVDAVERIIQFGLANGFIFDKLNTGSFAAHHGINN